MNTDIFGLDFLSLAAAHFLYLLLSKRVWDSMIMGFFFPGSADLQLQVLLLFARTALLFLVSYNLFAEFLSC